MPNFYFDQVAKLFSFFSFCNHFHNKFQYVHIHVHGRTHKHTHSNTYSIEDVISVDAEKLQYQKKKKL